MVRVVQQRYTEAVGLCADGTDAEARCAPHGERQLKL
jgi:hypothetical protein